MCERLSLEIPPHIEVGGKPVSVQIGLNLTIVGSKDLPKDAGSPAAKDE